MELFGLKYIKNVRMIAYVLAALILIVNAVLKAHPLEIELNHLEIEKFKEEVYHKAERWEAEGVELLRQCNEQAKDKDSDTFTDRDRD